MQDRINEVLKEYNLSDSHNSLAYEVLDSNEGSWEYLAPDFTGNDILAEAILEYEIFYRVNTIILLILPKAHLANIESKFVSRFINTNNHMRYHILNDKLDLLDMQNSLSNHTSGNTYFNLILMPWTKAKRIDFQHSLSNLDINFTILYNPCKNLDKETSVSIIKKVCSKSHKNLLISSRGSLELYGYKKRRYTQPEDINENPSKIKKSSRNIQTDLMNYERSEEEKDFCTQLFSYFDSIELNYPNNTLLVKIIRRMRLSLSSGVPTTIESISLIQKHFTTSKYGKAFKTLSFFAPVIFLPVARVGATITKNLTEEIKQKATMLSDMALLLNDDTKLSALIKHLEDVDNLSEIVILTMSKSTQKYLLSCLSEFNPYPIPGDSPLIQTTSSQSNKSIVIATHSAYEVSKLSFFKNIRTLICYDLPRREDVFLSIIKRIAMYNKTDKLTIHFMNDVSNINKWEKQKTENLNKQTINIIAK